MGDIFVYFVDPLTERAGIQYQSQEQCPKVALIQMRDQIKFTQKHFKFIQSQTI